MAFDFPLQAVLRYRESIEQREYFFLEKIQQEINQVEVKIRQAEADCAAAIQNRSADLTKGVLSADVQSAYNYQKALEQQITALRALWQELKAKWRQQLATYSMARRNREMLEKLRENQLAAYTQEKARREQAVIDDIFLSRRRRGN